MQINSIDTNNFEGRFIIKRKTNMQKCQFIRESFNFPYNGKSNNQILDKKSYDVDVYQTSKRHMYLVSKYKTHNFDLHIREKAIINKVSLNDNLSTVAENVRKHIAIVDAKKKNDDGFNSFGERIKTYFKMVLGL